MGATYRAIQWTIRSEEGRQNTATGSKLFNFYPVELIDPKLSKVPVMLLSSPGQRRYIKIPVHAPVNNAHPMGENGVHFMLEINSPIYGRRLVGLCNQYQFFQVEAGQGKDIPMGYDPFAEGASVYKIDSNGVNTFVDFTSDAQEAIPADQPRKMVTDGRRVVWVAKNNVYMYDYAKKDGAGFVNIVAPTPADVSTNEDLMDQDWVDCEWIDGYFFLAAKSGQFFHSLNDSEQFDQLDFARASSNPDGIVGLAQLARRLYIFGTNSIENWLNSGSKDFAFTRDNSFVINVGCIARATIATNLVSIIFVGSDLIVYAMAGAQLSRISTDSVDYDIGRSDPSKARAYTYTEEGHRFYSLTLTLYDDTKLNWTYDFTTDVWHERSEVNVLCSVRFLGRRNLIGREGMRHVFEQRLDYGANEDDTQSSPIEREAISPIIFADYKRVNMNAFTIEIPLAKGGRGDYLIIDYSDDGKRTYQGGKNRRDGSENRHYLDNGPRIRNRRMGQFREGRNIRIRTKAKRRVDILGAYVFIDVLRD